MKALKKPLSMLLALLMCFGVFSGMNITAFAAGEEMTTYLVDLPRSADPQKAGWDHPALNLMGGWTVDAGDHFTVHAQDSFNGRAVYCIEPGVGVHTGDKYQGRDETFWDNYPSSMNPTISPSIIKAYLGRIMQYGWQGNASTAWDSRDPADAEDIAGYIATQLLVWETVVGERDSQFNHVNAAAQGKDSVAEYVSASHPLYDLIFEQYYSIENQVQRHTMLPSFFSHNSASAGSYELKWDGEKYSVTLTDENNVLSNFTFTSSTAGLDISASGNKLTISSDTAIKGSVSIKAEKTNGQRSGVVVWTDGKIGSGQQDYTTYGVTVSDPVTGYLNLEVKTGSMKLVKTSEDGKVEGISFTISGEGYHETKTTNSAGEIDISDLNPGVYTVTEQTIDRYEPQQSQRVTIVSGQTVTVHFSNVLKRGDLEVTKTSEDGLVEGATFHLYGTSLSGLEVDEYAVADSTGVARFEDVLIGTGYVLEEVDVPVRYVVPEAQSAAIEWNEVTHKSFQNILKKFRVTVTKSDSETGTAQGDASLAGATYGIYKGDTLIDSYTTDENSQFTTQYYVCDSDWSIREIYPSEGYLLDPTVYPVGAEPELYEIELNDTAIDATEEIIKGNIAIIKHTDDGETQIETPEEGAEFQIYLKSAGSYENAKESERDYLTCDENGFCQSKDMPYGIYTVHQTVGWPGRELMPDFDVYIAQDGQTYRYLINNANFESYIKIVKVDAETGQVIPYAGAGFQLYNPDGSLITQTFTYPEITEIDTFYTNADGYLITPEPLEYGTGFSLVEVQAPYGYTLSTEPVYFDVTQDASSEEGGVTIIEVVKENVAQKGVIKVSKTGEVFASVTENNSVYQPVYEVQGLSGAVFEITAVEDVYTPDGTLRYSAGEVVDTITTGPDGTAQSKPLYLGKFEIREIEFPYGKTNTGAEPQIVELTYAGQEIEITETSTGFYSERQKVMVTLDKVLEQDERFQLGMNGESAAVTFGLFAQEDIVAADGSVIPADGLMEILSLNENGSAICQTDLPFASFYLKELSTDSHYLLNGETFPFTFEYAGASVPVVEIKANNGEAIENKLIRGEIKGMKTDENGTGLEGAVIGLFREDETEFTAENAILTATSLEDGSFSFEGVPYGNWLLKEVQGVTGFALSDEVFPVTIDEDGAVVEITIENQRIYGNLRLTKVDKDYPGNKLTGAEFEVYRDSNGNQELDEEDELLGLMEETSTGIYEMTHLANLDFDEMIAFAEEQYENRQPTSRADEMLRQVEQIAAASALPPEERFFLIETDDGYAVWDDQTEAIYVDDEGVSEEFTSEWQAQAYLEEVKKAVSEKQAAEWLAVERAKLPPLEYAAGDHFVIFSEDGKGSSEFVLTRIEENEVWYTFPDLPQQAPVSMRREEFENNLRSGRIREQSESRDYSNDYRLLDRLRTDCDYYLGAGGRSEKHLWAGSVEKQIAKMRELYASLPEKPEWLSEQDIDRYEQQMTVSHERENDEILGKEISVDERRFVVESVSDDKASLRDLTFEESVGFPINRIEDIDTVRRLLAEQEPPKQEEPVKLRSVVIDLTAPAQEETPAKKEELPAPPPARREKVSPFVLHPEIPSSERHNFRITDDHLGEGGAKTKFKNNVAAIRTLKEIEFDDRLATPEEQEILSRYVGWGGLPQAFDENNEQWADEFAELYGLLSPEEYEAAKATTLNAHYTSPTVIKAIYQAVENMGFRTGNVLEPSCGIGNFFGLVPESMKDSKLFGVELDSITGRIAQQLYQQNSIAVQGFEDTELPDSFFDLAIGNVPFGSYSLHDKRYDKHHFLIHDYFFARTLDKVRPGGLIAFVTSKGTMDKQNPNVRKYIAERAELIGAIRLPNNAFCANAGTQVTTDIIFLQKREKLIDVSMPEADSGLEWLHLGQTENGVPINQYFIDHPEMVLGEMAFDDMMYGNAKETTCKPFEGESLSDLLAEAVQNLHAEYADYEIEELEGEEEDKSIPADPNVRNFSFTLVDGAIYYRENSRMFPVEQSLTGQSRVKGMIAIRDCVRRLIEYQTESAPDEIVEREQRELNRLYDSFTAKYGLLNSRANTTAFSPDSSFPILCSLEVLDENGNLERKATMFSKRTIKPYIAVSRVDIASEALAVSIGEKACVDLGFMASLMGGGSDRIEQIKRDLAGVIFKDPESGDAPLTGWQTADEYLSGRVREKLKTARRAAERDPAYAVNVEALEKVQPKDLTAGEIGVRLGTTWIPEDVIEDFTFELLGTPWHCQRRIHIRYSKVTGEWNVSEKSIDRSNIRAYNTYGTQRINAYKIIEDTLNLRDVRIFDTVQDADGHEQRVLNKKETAIAQDKQDLIKQKFQEWIWAEPSRRDRLCRIYNEKFNSIRPREYDGSHIVFAGMNPEIKLRPHQRNAVARAIYGGNALFGHVVGAGKSYEMIATAVEAKRLGLSNKSLFVVPNNIIGDFASDFLKLYPSANILMATKKDFEKQNRKKFCARIATGDYDGIIIGHSQFEKIPLSTERQQAMLKKQIAEIVAGIAAAKRQEGSRFTVKQMEKSKKNLEAKLKKLNDQSRKDDVVTFEELGVDRLFIDEADMFKNLYLYTKMRNVGGISQTEALKASDLYMKCRYLDELTGNKGVVFATGTPVSNSMAEMYTMQRYLQYDTLERLELTHFDSWAAQFGETVTSMELKPEGYTLVGR